MSRRLFALSGVVAVVLGLVYIVWPVGHIPPYDANLVRLAESDLQGYCAGDAFWKSGGTGSASLARECRKRLANQRPDTPNMPVVQASFCAALVANGWEGAVSDCLTIMDQNQYWPTYDGYITADWNRARQYPQSFGSSNVGSKGSGSRTGGHSGPQRTNNPTHQAPHYP